jgi:hypothetical protein
VSPWSDSRRLAAAFAILVLVCVPALTRAGQKLETASHAPSFSKNIDCPPKKVVVAHVLVVASPAALKTFDVVPVARPLSLRATAVPPSPRLGPPLPLRAPPSLLLA